MAEEEEEEEEADQQDGPCCRSSLSSSRWEAGGGAGSDGRGRGPAAWDRVRVDGGSGGGGGCRGGGDGRGDSELRGAAARTSAVSERRRRRRGERGGAARPRSGTIGSRGGEGGCPRPPSAPRRPRPPARRASGPAGGRGACQWPAAFRPQASACRLEGARPGGEAGRGEVRTLPGTRGGRARLRPEAWGRQAAQVLCDSEGPGREATAPRKRFWTLSLWGGGGEGVCKQAPPLPPSPSGQFISPTP